MQSNLTVPLALLCGLGVLMTGLSAEAQTASDLETTPSSTPSSSSSSQEPLKVFSREDDPNNLSNVFSAERASGTSLLNLLNRIQQVNSRSPEEFAEDQNQSFDEAVDAFRKKQQTGEATTPESPVAPAPQ
jgi:hypothetical protein